MKPFGARRLFRFPSRTRTDIQTDIRDEFEFHLDMRTTELMRGGMAEALARAQAEKEFGDARSGSAGWASQGATVERRRRLGRLASDLKLDAAYGVRLIRNSPGFSTVAILTLAVAIGGNTAIFSVINAILLKPPALGAPDTLARIHPGESQAAWVNFEDLRERAGALVDLAAYRSEVRTLRDLARPVREIGESVTANYFTVVGVGADRGRTILPSDARTDLIVISDRLWRARYGSDPGIVGRMVRLDRRLYEVLGVMPSTFRGMAPPGLLREFWIPIDTGTPAPRLTDRTIPLVAVIGRLAPGVSHAQAEAALRPIASQIKADHPAVPDSFTALRVFPVGGFEAFRGVAGAMMPVFVFVGLLTIVAGLVLLIGCANIAGLLLGRAAARHKEIAVRLALGAGRGRLIRQLLTESLLLALIGGAMGLLLAVWIAGGLNAIAATMPFPMEFDVSPDWRVLTYAFAVALTTALVFGLAPARRAARLDLVPALKDECASGQRQRFRQLLVVGQVAVCSILLVWGLLFVRSLGNVSHVDPGFNPSGVLLASVTLGEGTSLDRQGREEAFKRLQQRVEELPWVESAGGAWAVPLALSSSERMGVFIDDEAQEGNGREVVANRLTPGWFATVRVPLLAGRDFSWQDREGSPQVAIVNRTLAARFWNGDALGKRLRFTGRRNAAHDVQIVGVVADSKYWTLGETIEPAVYLPVHQADIGDDLTLHVRTSNFAATAETIERELQRIVPDGVIETQSMTDAIAVAVMPARVGAAATGAFGALAMLLSAMGIYGLVSFTVLQRTHEIGIRKAIGAGTSQIIRLVVGASLTLAGIGLLAGMAVGVLGAQALGGLIVGVSAADPITLAAVTLLVLLAALVSSALPALRAARMDPLIALRRQA